ncbi:MAG: hypothetical protein ACOYON_09525 [Fimbriimonas sp.]
MPATLARPTYPARIYVSRTSERDIKMREVEVYLDDILWSNLKYSKTKQIEVPAGRHVLRVTNRLNTRKLAFECAPGESIFFQVGQTLPDLNALLILILAAAPYRVFIEEVERNGMVHDPSYQEAFEGDSSL